MAKETFYFPHDFNATNDPKIVRLISACGMEGLGIYWTIIEILHQQTDGKISEEEFSGYIRFYIHDEQKATSVEQVLNKTQLLFIEDGFVSCRRVLENKKMRKSISESRSLAGKLSGIARSKPSINTEKKEVRTLVQNKRTFVEQNATKERKGKERKEEREEEKTPALPITFEFLKEQVSENCNLEKFSHFNPSDLAVKLSHVIKNNGFEKANGKKVKDWKSQIYLLMEKEVEFTK